MGRRGESGDGTRSYTRPTIKSDNVSGKCDNADKYSRQQYSILYGNVRSILNKMLEFKVLVCDLKPSIIMLCETFAKSDIGDAIIAIDGYDCVVRQDGMDTDRGKCRGLLIYCKVELNATQFVGEGFSDVVECAALFQSILMKSVN